MKKIIPFIFTIFLFSLPVLAETTYTETSRTECTGNSCTIYYGERYVYEDLQWKTPYEATTLSDKNGFYVDVISEDEDHFINVLSFNATSITMNITFTGDPEEYEYEVDDNKVKTKMKLQVPVYNASSGNLLYYEEVEYEIEIEDEEYEGITFDTEVFGKRFKYGTNSTIIEIKDNVTGNLGDATVRCGYPDNNYGQSENWHVAKTTQRGMMLFNISDIPDSASIDSARFRAYFYQVYGIGGEGSTMGASIYHVYNVTWDEDVITWNDQPCGSTAGSLGGDCNTTAEDGVTIGTSEAVGTWHNWTVTKMLNQTFNDYGTYGDKFSFVIATTDEQSCSGQDYYWEKMFYSAESTPVNTTYMYRPILEVTYTLEAIDFLNVDFVSFSPDDSGSAGYQVNPVENSTREISAIFDVEHSQSISTANCKFNASSEYTGSLSYADTNSTVRRYNCTYNMPYYATAETYSIIFNVTDSIAQYNESIDQTFEYQELKAIDLPSSLNYGTGLPLVLLNHTGLNISNSGNTIMNVTVSGTIFTGQTNSSYTFGIGNVTWDTNPAYPSPTELKTIQTICYTDFTAQSSFIWYSRITLPQILGQEYQSTYTFGVGAV